MKNTKVSCLCGSVIAEISGDPVIQAYCHCDDCQTAHSAAYVLSSVYPSDAVNVQKGELTPLVVKTTQRMRCSKCGTFIFTDVKSANLRSVNAMLLPKDDFKPQFHLQCQYAVLPVVDNLPHYKGFPAAFGGTDDLVSW